MVNAGRVVCLFTPFALCISSLVCIILVFLGGWRAHSTALGGFYFMKADLSNFTGDAKGFDPIPGTNLDNKIVNLLTSAKSSTDIKDYYTVYLWNYCSWDGNNTYDFCSQREGYFVFDPVKVWGLENSGVENAFPKQLQDGLKAYHKVARWMFIAYVVALVATIVELFIGISALFSRWGSFCTAFVSGVSSLFILAASATATAMFSALLGAFNGVLRPYGIRASLGQEMMRTTWLAVLFSFGAGFFWLLSICCCSARSPYGGKKDHKRVKAEKTPYTYERVGSPYLGPQGGNAPYAGGGQHIPMHNMPPQGAAYEPFRTHH